MIRLTRINGEEFVLNAALIRYVESRPDTFITLTTDERIIVKERVDEVIRRTIDYSRTVRLVPGLM
jgi:flagellar protein FlbD